MDVEADELRPWPVEKIAFEVADPLDSKAAVVGELRMPAAPASAVRRASAVLIVNSSPGFDGRGAFYAEALARAGIASLEVDFFQGRGVPASPRHNLPHAFQALRRLADDARIDGRRVGIMGFSWGGQIALLASSDALARQYGGGEPRFAAHLALYPQCWRQRAVLAGTASHLERAVYERLTGRPVQLATGASDDYDSGDDCRRFVNELPDPARADIALVVYPGATFAWDSRFGSAVYEAGAHGGKGGIVKVVADADTARQSRELAVAFFARHLAAD